MEDDANWTLVESKQTQKLQEKERIHNLAQFLPVPMLNEGSVATSKETASSNRRCNKTNLKKKIDEDKLSSGTTQSITINKYKKNTKPEEKEVIDVSSNTDTFDDLTSISESTTEDSSGVLTIGTRSSSEEESSIPNVYQRKCLNKNIREKHIPQNVIWTQLIR